MNIRTVFDTRTNVQTVKYYTTILLLAASWHKYLSKNTNLEILHIGKLPIQYEHFFKSLDIQCTEVSPNINSSHAKTTNCIEAATPSDKRLLMVDNDVVFMDELSSLKSIPEDHIAASYTGTLWVSDEQWNIIRQELKLPVLTTTADISPLKELYWQQQTPTYQITKSDVVYVNAGVLVIPAKLNLKSIWERDVKLIADYFKNHELKSRGVYSSCQAGLATAIGAYKKFCWFPIIYNYRSICFVLGMNNQEDIKIMHVAGDIKGTPTMSSFEWVIQFWQEKMYDKLDTLCNMIDKHEYDRRKSNMDKVKIRMLNLMDEYRLHF